MCRMVAHAATKTFLLSSYWSVSSPVAHISECSAVAQCIAPFIQDLQPGVALGYLLDVQYQISAVLTPDIAFLSSNFSSLVVRARRPQLLSLCGHVPLHRLDPIEWNPRRAAVVADSPVSECQCAATHSGPDLSSRNHGSAPCSHAPE